MLFTWAWISWQEDKKWDISGVFFKQIKCQLQPIWILMKAWMHRSITFPLHQDAWKLQPKSSINMYMLKHSSMHRYSLQSCQLSYKLWVSWHLISILKYQLAENLGFLRHKQWAFCCKEELWINNLEVTAFRAQTEDISAVISATYFLIS